MNAAAEGRASESPTRSGREDNSVPIRLLPEPVRQELCEHLDSLDVWQQLAAFVKLYPSDVQHIRNQSTRGRSPSMEFLNIWGGQYNHTVYNLFALFHKMKLHNAMRIIKDHVDDKFHKYIPRSMPTISELRAPPSTSSKINNGPPYASSSGVTDDSNMNSNSLESPGDIRVSSVQRAAQSLLEIDYEELVIATENWRPENKLGNGGFGEVFKGEWKQLEVAIKAMNYIHKHNDKTQVHLQQSYNELKYLNTIRHDNILALYGYSINGEKPCLVYQLMKGGSLDSRLRVHKSKQPFAPLTWQQRLCIALGTAKGIYFLHTARSKPLIHGDIKPANILLDQCLQPKIGDFGLAREGPKSIDAVIEVRQVFGTRIYLPPEFLTSKKLSTGVDIYSFGVVLLEVFTGRLMAECTLQNDQQNLLKYVKAKCLQPQQNRLDLFDKHLVTPMGDELDKCLCAIEVGLKCAASNPQDRPSMDEVVRCFKTFSSES
ncbi:PREDICTED: serine/threonine-protein kinase pelle [Drosophila arizonae]|uniref:Serine/threonine-protein kinase pelle n=1 Tax=Drosophila arizonae TaxID=7263 RepID=A0ABM1Q1E3_DROAR|nr:PREDICTED: serine/threonine-protein kinase pelle [Drosophila arizonae]